LVEYSSEQGRGDQVGDGVSAWEGGGGWGGEGGGGGWRGGVRARELCYFKAKSTWKPASQIRLKRERLSRRQLSILQADRSKRKEAQHIIFDLGERVFLKKK